jgi:hypothetical protein
MRRAPSRSRWLERRARAAASAIVVAALLLIDVRRAAAEPASALVMPFDASTSTVSFLVVSHPAGEPAGGVRTHWAFWDETCEPLADVILCLPPDGSTIVDPRHVPASGGVTDLGGQRGFVTVTAYEPGTACDPSDQGRGTLSHGALIGSFTLADIASGVSFGGAAQALGADPSGTFVDLGTTSDAATDVRQTSLRLQSFDPADLDVSRVILIALEEKAGAGAFRAIEPGPVSAGADDVQTSVRFAGRDGASITLPEARLGCATFTSLRRADTPTLLPVGGPGDAVSSGGFLALENPRIGDRPLGRSTALIGFHGQGVGTFGVLAVGDTTLGSSSAPTPAPTGAATATPRPSTTPTARPSITPTPRATGAVSPTPAGSATPRPTGSIVAPTTTPVATPTVVVIATPSPAASTSPHAPTPSPAPTVTKAPGTTPTAGPSASPAPSATPHPTATAAPSTTPSPKPTSLPPTATAAACSTLTIQVRTTYGAGAPGNVSGVVATVTYPTSVAIPGTGSDSSVTGRVSNVSGVSGLFQATDMETQVRAGLISVATAIPAGPFVRVQFDCVGGAAPSASAFGCTLEASTLEGDLLPAAACSTEVVS